ncbi:hypothetical protein MLV70_22000 [Escherichia coli]|nr:hypothetical protein [Escherichia coli]
MGRKKKNNLKRIEKNSNFNSTRQRPPTHTNNEIPGEEIIFILETESPELSDQELEIIQSMPGVYFRPMKIFEKGKIMINYQLLETTFFKEAKQLAEVFISLAERAKEENDFALLDDVLDDIATYRIPLQIALNKAKQIQQEMESADQGEIAQ